jgi:hypothetical protein
MHARADADHDVDRPGKPDSTFLELACHLLYIR